MTVEGRVNMFSETNANEQYCGIALNKPFSKWSTVFFQLFFVALFKWQG